MPVATEVEDAVNEPTELPGPNDPALTTEKGSRRMLIGLILVSVTIAAVAQITLKSGVDHVTEAQGGELHIGGGGLKALLSSPLVWAGLVLFGARRPCRGCSRCPARRCRSRTRSRRSATC